MIVIADSGSTKTDWCLGNTKTNSRTVRTGGINPLFHQGGCLAALTLLHRDERHRSG